MKQMLLDIYPGMARLYRWRMSMKVKGFTRYRLQWNGRTWTREVNQGQVTYRMGV